MFRVFNPENRAPPDNPRLCRRRSARNRGLMANRDRESHSRLSTRGGRVGGFGTDGTGARTLTWPRVLLLRSS